MPCEVLIYLKTNRSEDKTLVLRTSGSKAETCDRLTSAVSKHEAILGDDPDVEGLTHWIPWTSLDHAEITEVDE